MKKSTPSMDDVLDYVGKFAEDSSKKCAQAMFYFLYKEILVNRVMLMENGKDKNLAGVEHNEKTINDLNKLLMDALEGK